MLMYMGPLAVRHEYARNFAAAAAKYGKTAAAIINLSEPDMRDIFQAEHIPVFDAATDACFKMLRAYIDYGRYIERRKSSAKAQPGARAVRPGAEKLLAEHQGAGMLAPGATAALLGTYGFHCAASREVNSLADATMAAHALGYPIILKTLVVGVAHRSDAGLVSRKIAGDADLEQEYGRLDANAVALGSRGATVSVEKFIAHDFEVILGVKYDATFGPVILCGLGGIFTEVLKDYALRLAPLTTLDAEEMLASLKAFPVLKKFPAHVTKLTAAAQRLSELALDLNGKIKAVDINPIGIGSDGAEPIVLDAKIHL